MEEILQIGLLVPIGIKIKIFTPLLKGPDATK